MSDQNTPAVPGARRALTVVLLTVFIDLVGFSILFPLGPAMLTWYLPQEGPDSLLGKTITLFEQLAGHHTDDRFFTAVLFGGILGSLYSLLQFIATPFWGRLSDRFGRRRILHWTIAGTAASYLLWFFSGAFWLLITSRLIAGLMAGNVAVATAAVADITNRESRAGGMAFVGVAFGLGFIFGPVIGAVAFLIDFTAYFPGLRAVGIHPFSAAALAALILALVNLWQVHHWFPETAPQTADTSRSRSQMLRVLFDDRIPGLLLSALVYFLFILVFSGMEFTLVFLAMERLGFGPIENITIFVLVGLVLLITQGVVVRRYVRIIGEKPMSVLGMIAGFAAMAALAAAQTHLSFYVGIMAMGIGIGLVTPTLSALASLYANEKQQGRALGAFRAAGSLARALGPILAASIYWRYGSGTAYAAGAALILLPLAISLSLPSPNAPQPTSERRPS